MNWAPTPLAINRVHQLDWYLSSYSAMSDYRLLAS